jgi:hypothetical protein
MVGFELVAELRLLGLSCVSFPSEQSYPAPRSPRGREVHSPEHAASGVSSFGFQLR